MIMTEQGLAVAQSKIFRKEKTGKLPNGLSMEGHHIDQKFMLYYRSILRDVGNVEKSVLILKESVRVYRLRELESDRYVLRKVLFVQIEKTEDGKTFIAKVPWLDIFGLGETEKEAINDFQLSLIEDYKLLKEEEDRLSNHLQEHLGDLTTVLREL